jgi:AraC-like DNA-binding protein
VVPLLPTGNLATSLAAIIASLTSPNSPDDTSHLASAAQLLEAVSGLPRLPSPDKHLRRIAPVLSRLDCQPHLPTDRAGLARLAGMSPSHFATVFRRATGLTPLAYLTERRLERAREMLAGGTQPITAVAQAVGFDDPLHFSRRFRARFGLGPAAWRRQVASTGYSG